MIAAISCAIGFSPKEMACRVCCGAQDRKPAGESLALCCMHALMRVHVVKLESDHITLPPGASKVFGQSDFGRKRKGAENVSK